MHKLGKLKWLHDNLLQTRAILVITVRPLVESVALAPCHSTLGKAQTHQLISRILGHAPVNTRVRGLVVEGSLWSRDFMGICRILDDSSCVTRTAVNLHASPLSAGQNTREKSEQSYASRHQSSMGSDSHFSKRNNSLETKTSHCRRGGARCF